MTTGPRIRSAALALLAGLCPALCACGSSDLSEGQLHARASRICTTSDRLTGRIATPSTPQEGARFLSQGLAVLSAELAQLRTLRTHDRTYEQAVRATSGELDALGFALTGLHAGNDPVVTIKTLEQKLLPLERAGDNAWRAGGVPACVAR